MSTSRWRGRRRGNTIVLVVGLLVLLMIIATSFITRTHAGRVTAISQQRTKFHNDTASAIAASLADEIAQALFPRPIFDDPSATMDQLKDSNRPRRPTRYNPVRYGIDQDVDGDGVPDFTFNFAPHNVVPFTNWPDSTAAMSVMGVALWPAGPGNSGVVAGTGSTFLDSEGNPAGNPGTGDTRWLADLEPVGWDTDGDGVDDAFSHWKHMTNIARPENGWRIVANIADVEASLYYDLGIPVEQWLAVLPGTGNLATGDSVVPVFFDEQWQKWFGFDQFFNYRDVYTIVAPSTDKTIPANFYNLSDLDGGLDFDGDGLPLDNDERPRAEFDRNAVAGRDSLRWIVSRVLADADGDGFTDSFWFLAPTSELEGIRQLVAVRIIDNSAMLNVNVATRFSRADPIFGNFPLTKTKGATPADLALTGELLAFQPNPPANWNVGFYDNYDHWFSTSAGFDGSFYYARYDDGQAGAAFSVFPENLWFRHLEEVGLLPSVSIDPTDADYLMPRAGLRLDYWRRAGMFPLGTYPTSLYTPFGLPEEIELRMFYGNNYPWIYSRLEHTTQAGPNNGTGLLRGDVSRVETNQYGRLTNFDLFRDSRHHLTTYSGARNDLMPPWLWTSPFPVDWNDDSMIDDAEWQQYLVGDMRKYDLRRPIFDLAGNVIQDVDNDGTTGDIAEFNPFVDDNLDNSPPPLVDKRDHLLRIRDYLDRALIIRDRSAPPDPINDESYFGEGEMATHQAEKMAAAMAANIAAYRDQDLDAPFSEAVEAKPQPNLPAGTVLRYLGLEAQPFLVEAVIAHVHEIHIAEQNHPETPDAPLIAVGNPVFRYNPGSPNCDQQTIVVVQIANPFEREIDLSNYRLSVFGQDLDLDPATMPGPADLQPNRARTYFSMKTIADVQGNPIDVNGWQQILDIQQIGIPGTLFAADEDRVNVTDMGWSRRRDHYDQSTDEAIELSRFDEPSGFWIVVDRIDIRDKPDDPGPPSNQNCVYRSFGTAVQHFNIRWPLGFQPGGDCGEPPNGQAWDDVILFPFAGSHWTQWARVSRPWVLDADLVDGNESRDDRENPRYVFARTFLDKRSTSVNRGLPYSSPLSLAAIFGDGTARIAHFASKEKHLCEGVFEPDEINTELRFAMQMLQKDADFEQLGELLNVWLFGHEISVVQTTDVYLDTTSTFSERLSEEIFDAFPEMTDEQRRRVNRLQVEPLDNGAAAELGAIIGGMTPMTPALPAAARVLDSFVCDGRGVEPIDVDLNGDGQINQKDAELRRYKNANGFNGAMTPALININTAAPRVLRSLPHMAKLVHETGVGPLDEPLEIPSPQVLVPEAIAAYRDRIDLGPDRPDYTRRSNLSNSDLIGDGLRSERGFASTGETLLLTVPPLPIGVNPKNMWRIDFAAMKPFQLATTSPTVSSQVSTDVVDDLLAGSAVPDQVAGDVEEANLLFAGMSNLITTRSDVFTVYFKIRNFRQNLITGKWDATDPEYIVDDSRYVMLVDRSEVNRPWDKAKIVYLEKLPK